MSGRHKLPKCAGTNIYCPPHESACGRPRCGARGRSSRVSATTTTTTLSVSVFAPAHAGASRMPDDMCVYVSRVPYRTKWRRCLMRLMSSGLPGTRARTNRVGGSCLLRANVCAITSITTTRRSCVCCVLMFACCPFFLLSRVTIGNHVQRTRDLKLLFSTDGLARFFVAPGAVNMKYSKNTRCYCCAPFCGGLARPRAAKLKVYSRVSTAAFVCVPKPHARTHALLNRGPANNNKQSRALRR